MKLAGLVICVVLSCVNSAPWRVEDNLEPRALQFAVNIKKYPGAASTTEEPGFFGAISDSISTAYDKVKDLLKIPEPKKEPLRFVSPGSYLAYPQDYSHRVPMFLSQKLPSFILNNGNDDEGDKVIQGVRYQLNNQGRLVVKEVPAKKKKKDDKEDSYTIDFQGLIQDPDFKKNRNQNKMLRNLKNLINDIVNLQGNNK